MKFIKSTLFATLLLSTSAIAQQFAATGVHAGFGVNSINPIATFENVSKFMESEDFKKQGITAAHMKLLLMAATILPILSNSIILMRLHIKKLWILQRPLRLLLSC